MNEGVLQLGWFRRRSGQPVVFAPLQRGDEDYMRLALYLAGSVSPAPNPPVGAVVAWEGRIVAVGRHERAGGPHAEVAALAEAGLLARGATLYVTLEPCNHRGKTPPCVEAILRSGIARVVIGCPDPNPHVRAGGAERLAREGVRVVLGALGSRAEALIEPWRRTLELPGLQRTVGRHLLADGTFAERDDP